MNEVYWTHCLYCRRMICGVEILEDYPDVVVLYAHTTCHQERRPVDPHATWKLLCEALHALDGNHDDADVRERAIDLLDILARWLRMGGFPPKVKEDEDGHAKLVG